MGDKRTVSGAARKIVELASGFAAGVTRAALLEEATRQFRGVPEQRLANLIDEAVGGGLLIRSEGRLHCAPHQQHSPPERSARAGQGSGNRSLPEDRVLRAVALDVESVVRTIATAPYVERHVYQTAAVRFGADADWVRSSTGWQRYLRLPEDGALLRSGAARDAVLEQGVSARQAWTELRDFTADADIVVAYNGTGLDFPTITEAAGRAGIEDPLADVHLVDALYLAHALWHAAPSHRLHELAQHTGLSRAGLRAHTADDDASLLVRLLEQAAAALASTAPDVRELVADVCPDSGGWRLLRELHEGEKAVERKPLVWEQTHVARLLGTEFSQHTPRRAGDGSTTGPWSRRRSEGAARR